MASGSRPSSNGPRADGPTGPRRRSIRDGVPSTRQPAGSSAAPTTRAAGGGSAAGTRAAAGRSSGRRRLIDYPRQGKTGIRRWLPSWRLVLGIFLTLGALAAGALVAAYAATDIPPPSEFADAQTTTVYYSDGVQEMGTFGVQNRVILDQEQIPEHVSNAVVAAEDRTFYENNGINVGGITRALWNNLRGGARQGGSSITQQYAERYYSDTTTTDYKGKFREALLAVKLDRAQDKPEILANYLNTIYFGRDSYGIETAAQSYFGISAAELTLTQGALIAGIIPSPNNWDPAVDPEKAEQRWNYVLDGMVTMGTLTQDERDAQVFPPVIEQSQSDTFAGPQGYLLAMAKKEVLEKGGITQEELDFTGYKIVTTIDKGLQDFALNAVASMPEDRPATMQTALVSLDPATGQIYALYGGADYLVRAQNTVTQDIAQAGSTFKPFTLIAYLENGGSLRSKYNGDTLAPVEGFDGGVRNFGRGDGESFGTIDLVKATANSVNSVYAAMNVEIGPDKSLAVAERAGIPAEDMADQNVPSNVLGTTAPNPLDMASAYNVFANLGNKTTPFIVKSVEYLDGGLVYEGGTAPEPVFAADVMADTTFALSQVVEQGTAKKALALGHPVAGKTGTSNENKSAWFIGYTPQMTTAVALFQPDAAGNPETISPFGGVAQVTGGSIPLDVWMAYMTPAMSGREVLAFPPRADIGEPNTPPMATVPSVVGLTEADAVAALGAAGFGVGVERTQDPAVPEGSVISQSPGGGAEAQKGSTVALVVSQGPPEPTPEPTPESTVEPPPTEPPATEPPPPGPEPTPSPGATTAPVLPIVPGDGNNGGG